VKSRDGINRGWKGRVRNPPYEITTLKAEKKIGGKSSVRVTETD